MAGVIATLPKFQFSANGIPLVGGSITAYVAGTTTPTNTWQDSALSIANTNPITLDARGECVLWLDPAINYKFVLKNAAGVVQWTQDNIKSAANIGAASGATLIGANAYQTQDDVNLERVSVKRFGAVEGVDCAAAIIAAAASTTGAIVIPGGDFTATATTANSAAICAALTRIRCDGTLIIKPASGKHALTSPITVASSEMRGLSIIGETPVALSIAGQVAVSGGAGAYAVVLQVSTVAGVAVGDYLHTKTATGTGYAAIHRGGWEITNVDAANTRITVKNTCRAAAFPVNTITASDSQVLKTVLSFANCDGFVVMGGQLDFINNVAIVGNSDTYWNSANVSGTEKGTHGFVIGANTVALNGKTDNQNPYGVSAAHVSCGPNVAINGFDQQGVVVENGGSFWGDFVSSCNNKRRGFYASTAAGIRAKHITANGNFLDGLIADIGGSIYASSVSCACGNGNVGASATQSGVVIFDSGILTNNGGHGGTAVAGGVLQSTQSTSSGNDGSGFYAEYGGTVYCNNSVVDANAVNGLYGAFASVFRASTTTITNNGAFGIRSDDNSVIVYSASTLSGNASGDLSLGKSGLVINGSNFLAGEVYGEDVRLRTISTLKGVRLLPGSGGDTFNFQFDTAGTESYSTGYVMTSNANGFYPSADNTQSLGRVGNRWSNVYAGTGTINTSDEREKQQIQTLTDAEGAVALRLKGLMRTFRFNDSVAEKGDKARIHCGVMAQSVKAAFEAEGLIAEHYALLCYDEWPDEFDADGVQTQVAGNRYGVRYEELLAFIIGGL